jgi:hypothetical protein
MHLVLTQLTVPELRLLLEALAHQETLAHREALAHQEALAPREAQAEPLVAPVEQGEKDKLNSVQMERNIRSALGRCLSALLAIWEHQDLICVRIVN